MSEWKDVRLGDICSSQNGYAFKSSSFNPQGKINVIKIKELKNGFVEFTDDTAKLDIKPELDKFIISKGDVLFALTGDPITRPNPSSWVGRVSLYNFNDPAYLNQRVGKIICGDRIDNLFLYYFFRQFSVFKTLASQAKGSASQANISLKDILDTVVKIPLLNEQQEIASILSSLDDKIAVNRRICENLEAQAQALFKHWFIDFAPFKNGKFVESELGMIPEGWKVGTLTEIADYLNGLAMQKFPPLSVDDAIPVLKIKELGQSQCDNSSDKCSKQIKPEYIIKNGDVVFSWSGTLMVDIWCGGICGLNQHLFKVTSDNYPKWFYLMWTKHHLAEFIRIAKDKAVTMGHIKRGDLEKALVAIPDSDTLDKMSKVMEDIHNQIINTRLESNSLSTLRDTLLPKLMSGQIKV